MVYYIKIYTVRVRDCVKLSNVKLGIIVMNLSKVVINGHYDLLAHKMVELKHVKGFSHTAARSVKKTKPYAGNSRECGANDKLLNFSSSFRKPF